MVLFTKICIGTALAVFLLFTVLAVRNRRSAASGFSLMLAGICVSAFFLFLPPYAKESLDWLDEAGLAGRWHYAVLRTAAYSLYDSIKAVGGGQEIGVMESFHVEGPVFRFLYMVMNYGYFALAPLMTSGLILSMIGDLWDQIRWRIQWRENYHVFSRLNPVSLELARKIREKHPRAVITFCDSREADKKLKAESRCLNALNVYTSCQNLHLPFGRKKMEYYLIAECEDDNLQTAQLLITRFRDDPRQRMVINALAAGRTGIQMVESMDKGDIGLRFFDGTALLCNNLLWNFPLCTLPEGRSTISVAILGCGQTGMQMLKTVAWCGQMDGLDLKIRVYDRDPAVRERFLAQCPELSDSCDMIFHTVDVLSGSFGSLFLDPGAGSPDATYCVASLGDDDDNMTAADRIYRICRVHNHFEWTPVILARVRSNVKSGVYADTDNDYLRQRRIHTFGGAEDALAAAPLFHSCLERLSFAVNLCYQGLLPEENPENMTPEELKAYLSRRDVRACRKHFLHSEYSRRSSMAAALHIPAKLQSCGMLREHGLPSDETVRMFRKALEQDPDLAQRLARNEHLRWSAFMRSEGFRTASWEMQEEYYPHVLNNHDKLSRHHLCIADWEDLGERNRKYLALNPPERKNFTKSDFDLVYGIPRIVMLTHRLMETGLDADM